MIRCPLSNFAGSSTLTVTVTSYIDGRFFQVCTTQMPFCACITPDYMQTQTAPFIFEAFAMISSATADVEDANNQRSTVSIKLNSTNTVCSW